MSALIQEANFDDMFNRQLMKIQDAIESIEQMGITTAPVSSQIIALKMAASDLTKQAERFQRVKDDPKKARA